MSRIRSAGVKYVGNLNWRARRMEVLAAVILLRSGS
jgi:hypothetical protein